MDASYISINLIHVSPLTHYVYVFGYILSVLSKSRIIIIHIFCVTFRTIWNAQ